MLLQTLVLSTCLGRHDFSLACDALSSHRYARAYIMRAFGVTIQTVSCLTRHVPRRVSRNLRVLRRIAADGSVGEAQTSSDDTNRRRLGNNVVETTTTTTSPTSPSSKFVDVRTKPRLHVHVGAGKLAMGLVIPNLMESEVPTVVLQTTRAPFDKLRGGGAKQTTHTARDDSRLRLSVKHRTKPFAKPTMRLLFDDADSAGFAAERLSESNTESHPRKNRSAPNPNSNTLIVSDDTANVWVPLLTAATSISTAVGPGLVDWLGVELLCQLPSAEEGAASLVDDAAETSSRDEKSARLSITQEKLIHDEHPSLPKVFCCENDHALVQTLRELLTHKANVIPVAVDKVCAALTIQGPEDDEDEDSGYSHEKHDEEEARRLGYPGFREETRALGYSKKLPRQTWTACVTTEPFPGMILPLTGFDADDALFPFDVKNNVGGVVRRADSPAAARFLHEKKLRQVNGTHTALAFAALRVSAIATYDGRLAVRDLNTISLRSLAEVSETAADGMWVWAVAETLALALGHDDAQIADALCPCPHSFQCDEARFEYCAKVCLRDARGSLARLSNSAGQDTVGRVLNAGVRLRLEGRMRVTRDAIRVLLEKTTNEDDPDEAIACLAGRVARAIVEESGFENLRKFSKAVDDVYRLSADVAKFVENGASDLEKRNNAVTRLESADVGSREPGKLGSVE